VEAAALTAAKVELAATLEKAVLDAAARAAVVPYTGQPTRYDPSASTSLASGYSASTLAPASASLTQLQEKAETEAEQQRAQQRCTARDEARAERAANYLIGGLLRSYGSAAGTTLRRDHGRSDALLARAAALDAGGGAAAGAAQTSRLEAEQSPPLLEQSSWSSARGGDPPTQCLFDARPTLVMSKPPPPQAGYHPSASRLATYGIPFARPAASGRVRLARNLARVTAVRY